MRRFIVERFALPPAVTNLADADRRGASFDKAQALAAPCRSFRPGSLLGRHPCCPALRRLPLHQACARADHRLDSGSTLDYIYRNVATGWGPLGRLIDHNYLNAIGWRGIRERKRHLEELLRRALARLAEGRPAHILDVAAGHGRYVSMPCPASPSALGSIRLRDYGPINVAAGGPCSPNAAVYRHRQL